MSRGLEEVRPAPRGGARPGTGVSFFSHRHRKDRPSSLAFLDSPQLGPDGFDWSKVRNERTPPRFSCNNRAVCTLSSPQCFEDFELTKPLTNPGAHQRQLTFKIDGAMVGETQAETEAELTRCGAPPDAGAH